MALRKARPVLLWFHTGDLPQAQVTEICESNDAYDVRFRKVVRDVNRDILEAFDALGGDVPLRYKQAAAEKGLEATGAAEVKAAPKPTKAASKPVAATAPPLSAPTPTDAVGSTPVSAVPPPAAT